MNRSIVDFRIYTSLFITLIVAYQSIYAQHQSINSNSSKEIWFDEIIGFHNNGLINGPEYTIPLQATTTHPFFGSRELTYENLIVDGQRFGSIPIMFDIYSNIVVIRHRDKNGLFALIQLKNVNEFTLYGHTFKNLSTIDNKGNKESPQLFDVLMEGHTVSLVAKRKKEIYLLNSKPEYRQRDLYYFLINEQKIAISQKRNIYRAFKIQEDEVRDFIAKNKLNFDVEEDLIRLSQFCDTLNRSISK